LLFSTNLLTLNIITLIDYTLLSPVLPGIGFHMREPGMQISTHSPREISATNETPSINQPCCPLCGGSLMPLHKLYRCSQCCYTICAGCEQVEYPHPQD